MSPRIIEVPDFHLEIQNCNNTSFFRDTLPSRGRGHVQITYEQGGGGGYVRKADVSLREGGLLNNYIRKRLFELVQKCLKDGENCKLHFITLCLGLTCVHVYYIYSLLTSSSFVNINSGGLYESYI